MREDEDQEDSSIGVTRYPCMPSLVALQQMRNRLHLAFVGKKLMKWTAQATGRELRKLGLDLIQSCHYGEDTKDAFILLARARYFYPNLNKMVLENIGHAANITVDIKTKSISGVKVLQLDLLQAGQDTYQHLGIDKGGQAILEAKQAWKQLLFSMIHCLEQREAFQLVDMAYRSANKKKNVLEKIIIPKLKRTIKFIKCELEDNERENLFRLNRFKQLKLRKQKTGIEAHVCCCCLSMLASEEDVEESTCPVCKNAAKAKERQLELRLNVVPCKSAVAQGKENKKLLDHLMSHIDDVIDLSRQYKLDGIVPDSIDKFIKTCSQVKETIEDHANAPPSCDLCKKFLQATGSRVQLASKTALSKSLGVPCAPEKTAEEIPPSTESCYNLSPENDNKLGYFENKFKEIVKVTRLQNEDGSVSEEKQVITVRTERRNPRKNGMFNSKTIGAGGGLGGGSGQGGGKGQDYISGTDYGGDGGPDFSSGPRETKSEHTNRSHQMGEPRLRSCMSASHPKSTLNKDASTNFDSSCVSIKESKVTLPPDSTDKKKTCEPLPKISKASSVDSIYCPRKTASVCGSQLESGPPSQTSIVPCKPVTTSASAQTCCKEVPVKKPVKDQGTCCLPTYGGDKTCPDDKNNKFKTTSTEALWRDAWTSTTDLGTEPSQGSSRPTSKPSTRKTSPVPSSTSKDSVESTEKRTNQKSGNCCTIKIIAKPPKDIKEKPKEPEKEVLLPGSLFEMIKGIFLPPSRSNENCKVDSNPSDQEIKNICDSCLSKLSSFAPSVKSVKSQSSCKMCQASMTSQEETKTCPSCGSLAQASFDSMSYKSIAIGSSTSHTCQKTSTPSIHSQKHFCCLENSNDDEKNTCCAMAQTNKSSTICCSKKKSSVCCPAKSSASEKSTKSASGSTVDASTCTKRSARFDVRPLRHTCEKVNTACTCRSDPYINRNKGMKPVKRSQSFYEDDYYYFKW